MLIIIFYVFALLLIWQAIISLVGGVRFLRYVQAELSRRQENFAPFASVIVPCRGVDEGLSENLRLLWRQDYPEYELIFVFDNKADKAKSVVEQLQHEEEAHHGDSACGVAGVSYVIAGAAEHSGQKVHNLRAGVGKTDARSEVYAFLDTDARPAAGWLRALVAPLADDRVGATTGYRWFVPMRLVPVRVRLAPVLRAVWNASIASALGADERRNFCWGGSTAIRRATFEKLNVRERWRGTLSDDFALTMMLRSAEFPIRFVPGCLVPSHEDCTFAELVEFTTRQIKITRVYAPVLWHIVLWSNLVFTFVFFGGIALGLRRLAAGNPLPLLLVCLIYLLGIIKAALRLRAVRQALAPRPVGNSFDICAQLLLFPLTSALYLYNAVAALFSRRVTWRGIEYELKSSRETAIIRTPQNTFEGNRK